MAPRIILLFFFFIVVAYSQRAPVTKTTAETWAQSIASGFATVEQGLVLGDQLRTSYLGATQIQTPIVGEQQVALVAVRLSSVLNAKLALLKNTKSALENNYAAAGDGNIQTVDASTVPPMNMTSPYGQPVNLQAAAIKAPASVTGTPENAATTGLNKLFADNRKNDPSIVYQYFGALDGSVRFFPAQFINSSSNYDARLTSWFGTALAPHKKVVVIHDSNSALTTAEVTQISDFLSTLSETDRLGVISGLAGSSLSLNTSDGCDSDTLLRGSSFVTASLKSALTASIGLRAPIDLAAALSRAFALIGTQAVVNEQGATPVIAIFSGRKVPDLSKLLNSLRTQYASDPRIFTHSIGASGDRFELRRIACISNGEYYEAQSATTAAHYLQVLEPSNGFSTIQPQWTTGIGFYDDLKLGVVLSASVPIVVNGQLKGVLGMDILLSAINGPFDELRRLTSYGFFTNLYGDTIIHPRLNNGGVTSPPYVRDIAIFETSPEFPSRVRAPMLSQSAGAVDFDLTRPLTQGDSTFNSEKLVQIRGYYYWQQLNNFPFVVVLTYAQQDLTDYDYDVILPPNTTVYFFNWMTLQGTGYLPPNIQYMGPHSLSFEMVQGGPNTYTLPGISYGNDTVLFEVFKYINDLPGAFNPGINRKVKSEGKVLKQLEPSYIQSWAQYADQFDLQLLYCGTPSSLTVMYPALALPVLLNFVPARRPWYQVAVSNPGTLALTPPYVDAALGNTVCTLASAITADSSRTRLLAVDSVDLTYPPLHSLVFGPTGCRSLQSDVDKPACYLFDESAILTTSFRFFDPIRDPATNQTTPIATVFLGEDEPELADALITAGLLVESPVDDYSLGTPAARRTFPYRVDSSKLNGTLSGSFASACQTGSYYIMKISGTNCYLAVVHNYTFNGRNFSSCPSFASSRVEPVSYSVCQGGNQTYGTFLRPTLSSDAATLEGARLPSGKCSGIPQRVEGIEGSDAASIILMVFAALTILAALFTLLVMFSYRKTPIVRTANPAFVVAHLLGIIIGVSCVFPWAVEPNNVSCVFIPFLGGIGFVLCFGAMLAKMIRIQRILSNTSLVSIPIATRDLVLYSGVMLAIEVVFLVIWQAVRTLEPGLSAKSSDSTTYVKVCKCDNEWVFTGIQIGFFGVLVLAGCVISVITRRVHTKILWSEPRWIAYSMYYVLVLGVLLVVVRAVIRRDPTLQFILTALCIILLGFGVLLLTYGVRLYVIFFKPKQNDSASATGGGGTGVSEFSSEFKPDAPEF